MSHEVESDAQVQISTWGMFASEFSTLSINVKSPVERNDIDGCEVCN
jgi:hypothetical protein